MVDEVAEILLVMHVEAIPDVTADNHSSESELAGVVDVAQVHASQGVDMAVDEPSPGGFAQLLVGEECFGVGLALAMEDVLQEYVGGLFLGGLEAFKVCARTAELSFVSFGQRHVGPLEVYAS